jgi:hypothetical protein
MDSYLYRQFRENRDFCRLATNQRLSILPGIGFVTNRFSKVPYTTDTFQQANPITRKTRARSRKEDYSPTCDDFHPTLFLVNAKHPASGIRWRSLNIADDGHRSGRSFFFVFISPDRDDRSLKSRAR